MNAVPSTRVEGPVGFTDESVMLPWTQEIESDLTW